MTIYYPTTSNFIQKTLDAQLLTGITASATLNNVTSIQNKAGVMIIDRVDANGVETPNKVEVVSFAGTSGSTVTTLVRALGGTTDQDHEVGAIVEFGPDIVWAQGLIDTFNVEHNEDGTHDTDYVVTPTGTQILTNKTLTSPKVGTAILDTNGNEVIKTPATPSAVNEVTVTNSATGNAVQIGATGNDENIDILLSGKGTGVVKTTSQQLTTPTFVGSVDGWVSAGETWSYASASTINVPSGAASKYSIGDSIRWKQGGAYKYGVISAVADTLLTIITNTDYTVANSAITDNYYTHSPTAIGLPAYYNFTPSWSNITVGAGANVGKYKTTGRLIELAVSWTFGAGAAVSIDAKFNYPVTQQMPYAYFGWASFIDASASPVYGFMRNDGYLKYYAVTGALITQSYLQSTSPFTWTTNDQIQIQTIFHF